MLAAPFIAALALKKKPARVFTGRNARLWVRSEISEDWRCVDRDGTVWRWIGGNPHVPAKTRKNNDGTISYISNGRSEIVRAGQ